MTAPSVAAVHDLSCVGRCALTVVLPALAAFGVQPVPLPTAVLSTHTGGFTDIASRDLTDFMGECLAHWRALGLKFDAVYSGYLADERQIDVVEALIDWQRAEGMKLAIVDPVMGDDGALYSAMPKGMPRLMRGLCARADVITPNLTEAALLTGGEYSLAPRSRREIFDLLDAFPSRATVITSVPVKDVGWATVCRSRGEDGFWLRAYEPVPAHFPGTGDLFASVLCAKLTLGARLNEATACATDFVREVILSSFNAGCEPRYGVQLERALARADVDNPLCEFARV